MQTEADKTLDDAQAHLQLVLTAVGDVVAGNVVGFDQYCTSYKKDLLKILGMLVDIRLLLDR